jgi:toxin FitB
MNIVDTSGWLEYFSGGPNAEAFSSPLKDLNFLKDLTLSIALNADKISLNHSLPMADSIILSTANTYKCTLGTRYSDFENLHGVNFIAKKSACQPGH